MYFFRSMVFVVLLVCMLPGIARAQGEDPLTVPAGQHVDGSIATMTQNIVVDGDVDGDVTSWRGDITVRGHVGGDVVSYAGNVSVAPSARIDGSVLAAGGQLQGATTVQVSGKAFEGSENGRALASVVTLFTQPSAQPAPSNGEVSRIFLGFLVIVFLAAFSLLWVALWPRRMAATTTTLHMLSLRSVGLGLLSTVVVIAAAVPLTALLTATIIGLPIIVVLLLLLQIPYLYGFAAVVQALGANEQTTLINRRTALAAFGMAILIGVVAALLPIAGLALFYLLASPGVGAAVLSRGGVVLPAAAQRLPSVR